MSTVFTSTIADFLKETVDNVLTDPADKDALILSEWLEEESMTDAWVDDEEVGGPGLASEIAEGTEIPAGTIKQHVPTRYLARKFGQKLIVTEEAIDDNKYDKVINAAARLRRSLYKTMDIDATLMLERMFNSSYVGGDGLCLGNSAHTLAHGGTYSNIMATPMSPSRAAVIIARTQAGRYPDMSGIVEGYELKKVVCPLDQWAVWLEITKSTKAPEAGQFNAINVVNSELGIEVIPIKYWRSSTTNYAFITDADNGLKWKWRKKPKNRSWIDNDNELMKFAITARWARGWSNPRAILGVNA